MLEDYVLKIHDLHCNISCLNADILVLTKTWLNVVILDEELGLLSYNIYQMDSCRTSTRKRGWCHYLCS